MRIAVAVSGGGSNLQALLDALPAGSQARVALVLSNTPKAGGLARAEQRGVPTAVFQDPANGAEWLALLEGHGIDLIVLAGYLKLVPPGVIAAYRGKIINIHPALLPEFGGTGMHGMRVHEAVLRAGRSVSGCTVQPLSVRRASSTAWCTRLPYMPGPPKSGRSAGWMLMILPR